MVRLKRRPVKCTSFKSSRLIKFRDCSFYIEPHVPKKIKPIQRTIKIAVPQFPFHKMIKESFQKLPNMEDLKIQRLALEGLHESAEIFTLNIIERLELVSACQPYTDGY